MADPVTLWFASQRFNLRTRNHSLEIFGRKRARDEIKKKRSETKLFFKKFLITRISKKKTSIKLCYRIKKVAQVGSSWKRWIHSKLFRLELQFSKLISDEWRREGENVSSLKSTLRLSILVFTTVFRDLVNNWTNDQNSKRSNRPNCRTHGCK